MTFYIYLTPDPAYAVEYKLDREVPEDAHREAIRGQTISDKHCVQMPTLMTVGNNISIGKAAQEPAPIYPFSIGWITHPDFAALVERFEPGTHQLFPLKVNLSSGRTLEQTFYIIAPGPRIDAIIPQLSNVAVIPSSEKELDGRRFTVPEHLIIDEFHFRLSLDSRKIRDRHFWFGGPRDGRSSVFCSDSFCEAARNITAIRDDSWMFFKCEDVDAAKGQ
jgi:hypothetical protein